MVAVIDNPQVSPVSPPVFPAINQPEAISKLGEARTYLNGVSWSTFLKLLAEIGDNRIYRLAYATGVLEIKMPLPEHEETKYLLDSFVAALMDELGLEFKGLGSVSLKRENLNRFIEPDSCFYIQSEPLVRGQIIDPDHVPAPDLAIESDYRNSSLNKLDIYAQIGVPEVWRYTSNTLLVYHLIEDQYQLRPQSRAFPFLPIEEIPNFIQQGKINGQRGAVRSFRSRIREILANI